MFHFEVSIKNNVIVKLDIFTIPISFKTIQVQAFHFHTEIERDIWRDFILTSFVKRDFVVFLVFPLERGIHIHIYYVRRARQRYKCL